MFILFFFKLIMLCVQACDLSSFRHKVSETCFGLICAFLCMFYTLLSDRHVLAFEIEVVLTEKSQLQLSSSI